MTRPQFIAGSTRLRARMSRLSTASGPGGPMMDDVRGELHALPGLFVGEARTVAEVLIGRQDLQDCLTLIRGAMTGRPAVERLRGVWAAGAMTPEHASELAHVHDAAAAVAALERWGLPVAPAARRLPQLWSRFELHGDVEELELGLVNAAHAAWAEPLTDRRARPAAALLARERDQRNLVTTFARGEVEAARLLLPGRVSVRDLEHVVSGRWGSLYRKYPRWRPALEAYAVRRDLVRLDADLHDAATRGAAAMLRRGDPATAEPLAGYVLLLEDRARRNRRARLATAPGVQEAV